MFKKRHVPTISLYIYLGRLYLYSVLSNHNSNISVKYFSIENNFFYFSQYNLLYSVKISIRPIFFLSRFNKL